MDVKHHVCFVPWAKPTVRLQDWRNNYRLHNVLFLAHLGNPGLGRILVSSLRGPAFDGALGQIPQWGSKTDVNIVYIMFYNFLVHLGNPGRARYNFVSSLRGPATLWRRGPIGVIAETDHPPCRASEDTEESLSPRGIPQLSSVINQTLLCLLLFKLNRRIPVLVLSRAGYLHGAPAAGLLAITTRSLEWQISVEPNFKFFLSPLPALHPTDPPLN